MAKSDNPESTPAAPDPWAVLDRLAAALDRANSGGADPQLIAKLTTALERVSETQLEGAKLVAQETRRANRPSNEVIPNCSVFNRRGELLPADTPGPHKPVLKCQMLVPWLIEWESINREEAELLNLLEPGEYNLMLIDRSKIRFVIRQEMKADNRTPSRLMGGHIGDDGQPGTAFNKDNFRLVPPLSDWLRQLLKQHSKDVRAKAAAILTDEEEEALIEAGELAISR